MFTFLPFDTLCILEFIQYLKAFFIRTSKNLMRLSAFFEGLQLQNVLIMFLFPRKHSYLLTAKITPDVNKSNFYMVRKSYCGWFSTCLMQLLVSGYGLNNINSFGKFFLQEIAIIVILIFCWTSQPKNVLNLLLFIINFQPRYSWNVLIKKCVRELMKSINTLISNLIKCDLARVRKSC